jgi:acyl-CoA synthetase (AMP-forming)/AMP-acid ligase II
VDIDVKKDTAMVLFTGGTTGTPKACMYPHHSLIGTSVNASDTLIPPYILSLGDGLIRWIIPLPLFHVLGHNGALSAFNHGWSVLLQKDPRDVKEYIRLAKKYHPLVNIGVPVQFTKLVKEEDIKGLGLLAISSGAPLHPDTQRSFEKKAGGAMGEVYGPTEVGGTLTLPSVASLLLPVLGSYETIGKVFHLIDRILKTPGVTALINGLKMMTMRVMGPETMKDIIGIMGSRSMTFVSSMITSPSGRRKEVTGSIGLVNVDCEPKFKDMDSGETIPISRVVKEKLRGELWAKGPGRMSGFWPNPGSGIDEEGFVNTGDVATIDETGHIYIVDRTKDMALVGGYDVYTEEIDKLLESYQRVGEAATIGIPDPERPGSERIKVFIAPLPEYKGKIKEEDIINYLKEKVAPYAVPKSVEFRDGDKFPRATSGVDKILKRKLREEEIEKMKKEGLLK